MVKKMFSICWNFLSTSYLTSAVGIQMGTNCAHLLADLFFHYYKAVFFIANLIQRKEHCLARSFDLSFRYIDDVLSLNNPSFGDFIHRIYPQRNLR